MGTGRRLVHGVVGLAVFWASAEGLLRGMVLVAPGVVHGVQPDDAPRWRWNCDVGLSSEYAYDPGLGWVPAPGERTFDGWSATHLPDGTRRTPGGPVGDVPVVAVLGDSYAYGEEVDDADTWPALLQAMRDDIRVWNLGVSGYSHEQILLRWRAVPPDVRVDAVILGYATSDLVRNGKPVFGAPKPFAVLKDDGAVSMRGTPVPSRAAICRAGWWRSWTWDAVAAALRGPAPVDEALGIALLATLRDDVASRGVPFGVIASGPPQALERASDRAFTPEWSTELGVPWLDPSADLHTAHASGAELYGRTHFTRAGNQVLARHAAALVDAWLPKEQAEVARDDR